MTYNEIKQRVYDLLDMPASEVARIGYAGKIPRIFNEATFRVAHSILPNLREYKFTISADKMPVKVIMPPDFISFADEQDAYVNGQNFILTDFIDKNALLLSGNEGPAANQYTYTVYYNAYYPEIVNGGKSYKCVRFVNRINEDYEIVETPIEEKPEYEWSPIVSQLIPHYIVSQLLSSDDKTRSIVEMNNFETLLATVNVERHERQREYHSVRGWY